MNPIVAMSCPLLEEVALALEVGGIRSRRPCLARSIVADRHLRLVRRLRTGRDDLRRLHGARLAPDLLAVAEENQGRDAANAESRPCQRAGVAVDLGEDRLAFQLTRRLLELRRHRAARAAPRAQKSTTTGSSLRVTTRSKRASSSAIGLPSSKAVSHLPHTGSSRVRPASSRLAVLQPGQIPQHPAPHRRRMARRALRPDDAGRQPGQRRHDRQPRLAERADLDEALEAAAQGLRRPGSRVSAYERSKIMRKAANLLRERDRPRRDADDDGAGQDPGRGEGRDPQRRRHHRLVRRGRRGAPTAA